MNENDAQRDICLEILRRLDKTSVLQDVVLDSSGFI